MHFEARVMHYPDNLSWVNMQNPADIKDTRTARIIRSHAQREFRRRERDTRTKSLPRRSQKSGTLRPDGANGEPVSQVAFDDEDVKASEELSILPTIAEISREVSGLALALSNPFTKGPSPRSLRLHHSISRYMTVCMSYPVTIPSCNLYILESLASYVSDASMASNSVQTPRAISWIRHKLTLSGHGEYTSHVCGGDPDLRWKSHLPTAATKDGVLYAQAFYSTCLETWSRQINAPGTWALKHQAILHINQNLNDPALALSNANLQCVLNLAHATHLENLGKENYTMHMNGLRKMIALRGGWEEMRSDLLRDVLAMCDYVGATIFRTNLSYVTAEPRPLLQPPRFPPSFTQTCPLLSPDVSDPPFPGVEILQDASHLITELREMTTLFESHDHNHSLHDKGLIATHIPANNTLSSSHSHKATSPPLDHQMRQSIHFASLIYIRAIAHDIPFGHDINLETMQLLRQALKPTLLAGWRELPGALLWVLLVGMAAERDRGVGNMLAGYTSLVCHCVGFREWGAVRELLQRFMAIEAKVDERAGRVQRDRKGVCAECSLMSL